MALKYRIVYGSYSRYQKRSIFNKPIQYLFPLLLCAAFVLCLVYSPDHSKYYELLLPGDPAVTTDAFRQLSDAIRSGETFIDALDVFCETVMDVR